MGYAYNPPEIKQKACAKNYCNNEGTICIFGVYLCKDCFNEFKAPANV